MNMRAIALVLSLVLTSATGWTQGEAAFWYFGENAGLQFDLATGVPTPLTDGALFTREGCSTISDANGNLLFYSDGSLVWNRNHQIMPNGTGLFGNPSSTQSALIVPKPGDPDIYYLFTVSTPVGGADQGFNYSEVDMSLDGGLGDVAANRKNIPLLDFASEKITAVAHPTNAEIWVIAFKNAQDVQGGDFNTYVAYNVSATGVNVVPVESTFQVTISDRRGNLKISPDGTKLACANMTDGAFLYDFDATTGIVSNQLPLQFQQNPEPYGVEFSPDNSKLYVVHTNGGAGGAGGDPSSHRVSLSQFDLDAQDINLSRVELDERQGYRASLQLGLDGKIYKTQSQTYDLPLPYLGRIENPDSPAASVIYDDDAIQLPAGTSSSQGLPPFIQSLLASIRVENLCFGDITEFEAALNTPPDAVAWQFGDGATDNTITATHTYAAPGVYLVELTVTRNGISRTFSKEIEIFQTPTANVVPNQEFCDDNNDGVTMLDLTQFDVLALNGQDPQAFEVSYHLSANDADGDLNSIDPALYSNTANPEQIFVRVENRLNPECYDTSVFTVQVFDQPSVNTVGDLVLCDDVSNDGSEQVDLSQFDAQVLGPQSASQTFLAYYANQADADARVNPLPSPYTLALGATTIIARVENLAADFCYATTPINLSLTEQPIVVTLAEIEVCDDPNNDGNEDVDLSQVNAMINAAQAAAMNITYHDSQAAADSGASPLAAITNFPLGTTPIFVRVENPSHPNCFAVSTVDVTLYNQPLATAPVGVAVCDDATDGDEMNGIASFDLTALDTQVLDGQNPAQYNVTYYASQADAEGLVNALASPFTNTTAGSQTIFARVDNAGAADCNTIVSFDLVVNPLPVVQPIDLFNCDEDGVPDGSTLFNLSQADSDILSGQTGLTVAYYTNAGDAAAGTNAVDSTNYANISNPEVLIAVATNDATGCSQQTNITLRVSVTDAPPAVLETCDDATEDGLTQFELSTADSLILNGLPAGLTVAYYASENDALLEMNALPNLYMNVQSGSQLVFARVEDGNDCYGISGLDLVVNPLPQIEVFEELLLCVNVLNEQITLDSGLLQGSPSDYSYQWSTGEMTESIIVDAVGTYTVTVTNTDGCEKLRSIDVIASNVAVFDSNAVITDAVDSSTGSVSFSVSGPGDYEFAIDDPNGPYQDSSFFDRLDPGFHTIYARDKNGCGISELTISIVGFPQFFTPNGDGYNETWNVQGIGSGFQTDSDIFIFDRYGKLLKQLGPDGTGWDGTYNNAPMPSSDYWFQVTLEDGRVFRGHFTLKR